MESKIIEVYQESTSQNVLWLANVISTIEQRYETLGNTTNSVTTFYKHPDLDIWWTYYDDISNNMGGIGSSIIGFLLGKYLPTGNPVINEEVLKVKTINLVEHGYIREIIND